MILIDLNPVGSTLATNVRTCMDSEQQPEQDRIDEILHDEVCISLYFVFAYQARSGNKYSSITEHRTAEFKDSMVETQCSIIWATWYLHCYMRWDMLLLVTWNKAHGHSEGGNQRSKKVVCHEVQRQTLETLRSTYSFIHLLIHSSSSDTTSCVLD
jgi:hypothetical protein